MPALVRVNPVEVTNRLEQLGWSLEELLEVVDAMVSARNSCTENDPSSAPGWMAWKEGTRRLRELGRPRGMQKDDTDQMPSLIDRSRRLRFLVSNTDEYTGVKGEFYPQNRSKKGPGTDRLVAVNQISLFPEEELKRIAVINGLTAWYVCVYSDRDVCRAELSCPVDVSGG